MRIRQLVLVSEEREPVVRDLCDVFDLEVAFYDPGIIHFGLENAVIPVGDTFLEVVSPVQDKTTAGRYLERRNGNGGYMVIVQTDDLEREKSRVESEGIGIVWNADREEEGIHAKAIHLHPRDVGGAILSIDSMEPSEAWLWASPTWEENVRTETSNYLNGVHIQSKDPESMMKSWETALGLQAVFKDNEFQIILEETRVVFVEDKDGRGEGIQSFEINVKDQHKVLKKAKDKGLLQEDNIVIGGVKFLLN
tara:strand:+ start:1011 stop:1763 length:753 start_codon:yes stop_codon:yes gene_type:complete